MLETSPPIAFIATATPDRARVFYAKTLGLPLLADKDPHGNLLSITEVRAA